MTTLRILIALGLILIVTACSTRRDSNPQRTATEQLLISSAADRAAKEMKLDIPQGAKVFVDAVNFEGIDGKYAIAALRERVVKLGGMLVSDREAADIVVEIRSGALSIDEKKMLLGIPEFNIPVPLMTAVTFPEIALFKKDERKGVAKFAGVAYNAKDGTLANSSDMEYGFSHETHWVLLLFISWETGNYLPEENRDPPIDFDVIPSFGESDDDDED